jgi:hypothetical protein
MMRQSINPHTLANEARMRRAAFKGSFMYVEGPSDQKFYGMFVDGSHCQIIIAHSRSNVIEACSILVADHFRGTVGIIDADFDHIANSPEAPATVFRTDLHDAECMMLASSAFEKVLFEFASNEKLQNWQMTRSRKIGEHLLQQAAKVGALVWHSLRNQINLKFEDLAPKEFMDEASLVVDETKLIAHVKNKSHRQDLAPHDLAAGMKSILEANLDGWQITRGHDYVDLLGFSLRKTLGSCDALQVARSSLEVALRLAYSGADFRKTRLYTRIANFQEFEKPFEFFIQIAT